MLESADLLLGPWLAANRSMSRKVFNAANEIVGSIHGFVPQWTWLRRPRFEIREGDDLSFLFSVSPRSWRPGRWWVNDADEQLLGTLIRSSGQRSIQAFSRAGLPVGELSWLPAKTSAKALSPRGICLVDIDRLGTGARITFTTQTDPFSRMVFLAATLVAGI